MHMCSITAMINTRQLQDCIDDPTIDNAVISETTFVEITKPQGNVIVGLIYRPPGCNLAILYF